MCYFNNIALNQYIDIYRSAKKLMFACSGDGHLLPISVVWKPENLYDSCRTGEASGWFDQKHFDN